MSQFDRVRIFYDVFFTFCGLVLMVMAIWFPLPPSLYSRVIQYNFFIYSLFSFFFGFPYSLITGGKWIIPKVSFSGVCVEICFIGSFVGSTGALLHYDIVSGLGYLFLGLFLCLGIAWTQNKRIH